MKMDNLNLLKMNKILINYKRILSQYKSNKKKMKIFVNARKIANRNIVGAKERMGNAIQNVIAGKIVVK